MAKKKPAPQKSAKKPQPKAKPVPMAKKGPASAAKAKADAPKAKAPVLAKPVAKGTKGAVKAAVPPAKGKPAPAVKAPAAAKTPAPKAADQKSGSSAKPVAAAKPAPARAPKGKAGAKAKPPVPQLPRHFFGKPVIGSVAPEKKSPPKKTVPPLTKADIEKLRHRLLAEKARILGTVHGMRNEALESGDAPSGDNIADHGTDVYEQDMTLSLVEREQSNIQAIDEALAKIADGTFGHCEQCETNIRKERLEALPYARNCLDCQEKHESNLA
jgi:RNA polymerase-binding protein DksA